jgi:ketosteroid isomerase-like protein
MSEATMRRASRRLTEPKVAPLVQSAALVLGNEERRSRRTEIVSRLYNEGWARGDFAVVSELLAPRVVWTAIEGAPDAGTYIGLESVRRYMQDWLDDFEFHEGSLSVEESVEVGDRLVCVQHVSATGKGSGIESEIRYACVYAFDDEQRIAEVSEYATREEAVAVASRASAPARR